MQELVLGTEAIATGALTRNDLRRRYVKLHRNVYVHEDVELTARHRAEAAWLWSGRDAVLVGTSAAALLGTRWLPADGPAEVARSRFTAATGIVVRSGVLADDEVCSVGDLACTTPARTAYDIGRYMRPDASIIRLDALLNATRCVVGDVEAIAARHPGARGVRLLRAVLEQVDGGAESPQETRLRLLLRRAGLPRPVTQIPVADDWGRVVRRIDMGWPQWHVGVEYDGEQHWDPVGHAADIDRLEFLAARRWRIVRVSARHLRYGSADVVRRARDALLSRGWSPRLQKMTETG